MSSWLAHPLWLLLLAALPALGVCGLTAAYRRRRALSRFGNLAALAPLITVRRGARVVRGLLLAGGLVCLGLGVAGPQWGTEPEMALVRGRDVVAVLDMSRSMLARDVVGVSSPDRLGRARDALADLAEEVRRRGGHRLGLIVFAARARVVCPLTPDYDHFREALGRLDPAELLADLGPGADAASGTRLGEALRAAAAAHDSRFRGHQDILILSDGDDPAHDDEWQEGVAAARSQGIRVHAVGIGDPDRESPIPGPDGPLRFGGREVGTKLQEAPLREIARQTGGVYTPARTRAVPLGRIFHETIEPLSAHETEDDVLPRYRQRYPWFFAAALALLSGWMLLGDRRPDKASAEEAR